MAKGSQIGLQKGKLGNTVKYRISGSNNKEEQGTRAYQPVVANPKTMAQASQRVKMTPAVNFYRAFQEEILDHSFQGEKYGARCHAAFMKAALKMNVGFPFVPMGRDAVAPGEYLMSRGSIPSMVYDWDDNGKLVCAALAVEDGSDEFGVWSQDVINAAPWLQNGDQITIGLVLGNEDGNEFPYVCRLILDTNNTTDLIGNILSNLRIQFDVDGAISLWANSGYDIEGAVIIVSRPIISQTTGAVTWLRSTERMKPNFMLGYMRQRFFSQDAYDAAMYSYMAASRKNITSDWYLNQGKASDTTQSIPDAPIDMPFILGATPQGLDDGSWTYGLIFATFVNTDGKRYIIANVSGDSVTPFGYSADGAEGEISKNIYQITTAGAKSSTDQTWVAITEQFDGIKTAAEAQAMAQASGVTLVFTMGE